MALIKNSDPLQYKHLAFGHLKKEHKTFMNLLHLPCSSMAYLNSVVSKNVIEALTNASLKNSQ